MMFEIISLVVSHNFVLLFDFKLTNTLFVDLYIILYHILVFMQKCLKSKMFNEYIAANQTKCSLPNDIQV